MSESLENEKFRLWAEKYPEAARDLSTLQNDAALRRRLKTDYDIPDIFLDIAIKIWWDGKED